jgi:threonine dehydratase
VVALDDIRAARELLAGVVIETPVFWSRTFSQWSGAEVHLKAENLQRTGSFKIRGAFNRLSAMSPEERRRGVVASSAGNHAQGVALAATMLDIPSRIYMPMDAPLAKQLATRQYGADIVLEGESFDDAQAAAKRDANGRTFISAFDDEAVVAGQGTLGLELLDELPDVDTVIVPLGGGGLLSGVATAIKAVRPQTRVIGVQAEGCAPYLDSLREGAPITARAVQTIADGIAVKRPGAVTFEIIQRVVDDVVSVSDEEICQAIVLLLERAKLLVEGAGAVSLAALLSGKVEARGQKVVCVLSGGNLDANLLAAVVRHGLTVNGRYMVVRTKILDRPGSLLKLLGLLAQDRINLLDVEHHREGMDVAVTDVEVELTVETRDEEHGREVLATLARWGYEAERVR